MTTSTQTSLLSALAACTLAFLGLSAHAHGSNSLTEMVSYADLNLETTAGTKVLYQRLHSAARQVCHPLATRSVAGLDAYEGCIDQAMGNAVAAINQPLLSALHRQTRHNA